MNTEKAISFFENHIGNDALRLQGRKIKGRKSTPKLTLPCAHCGKRKTYKLKNLRATIPGKSSQPFIDIEQFCSEACFKRSQIDGERFLAFRDHDEGYITDGEWLRLREKHNKEYRRAHFKIIENDVLKEIEGF